MHWHAHAISFAVAGTLIVPACVARRETRAVAPERTAAPAADPAVAVPPTPAPDPAPPDAFEAVVRPVLVRRCTPCHEPGGQMYARMPFDDAAVIRAHRAGLLRRLNVPEEKAAVEAWLDGR
jgi:hypothetical protein